jgi:hypothetical protein
MTPQPMAKLQVWTLRGRTVSWGCRECQDRCCVSSFICPRQPHGTLQVLGVLEFNVNPNMI